MEQGLPLVSVVIPTIHRPTLVLRAVRSALAQTLQSLEVIVVIDGVDEVTKVGLEEVDDSRLTVISLPCRVGVAGARNAGVHDARGRWIAFLDDDDEWLPEKLRHQVQTAQRFSTQHVIVSCRLIKRTETTDVVLPRRLPNSDEHISEYLFRRTMWLGGEALIQPSTIFTTKSLLEEIKFQTGMPRHEELDWLIRSGQLRGATVQFVDTLEPLVIWYKEEHRESMSSKKDWRFSFSWIRQSRQLLTPRAYASFLLTWVSANAVEQGDRSAW